MAFEAVVVYNMDGDFLGYGIKKPDTLQLQSVNIWAEDPEQITDLQAQLGRLNQAVDIRSFWPDVRDPEVVNILSDPNWMPIETSPMEVVDEDNSNFVWIEEPNDENPYGKMDEDASTLAYKLVQVPSPAHVQQRVKSACELVARRRAEANA
jgi:hypothetical protein